jgi:hypothetical protein
VTLMRKSRRLLQNKGYRANKLLGGTGFSFDSDTSALFTGTSAAHRGGAENAGPGGRHRHGTTAASVYAPSARSPSSPSTSRFHNEAPKLAGTATVTLHREPVGPPPLETEPTFVQPADLSKKPLVYATRRETSITGRWEARLVLDAPGIMIANLPDAEAEQTPAALAELIGFVPITRNIYHANLLSSPKRVGKEGAGSATDDDYVCECEPSVDPSACGPNSDCLNRTLQIECDVATCPFGQYCTNQQLQRGQSAPIDVFFAGLKGYGLRSGAKIEEGDFVYEYLGEVIDTTEFERRREVYHERGDKHFYFMTIDGDEVIDATEKASLSRLVNHSCNPNCELQKWIAPGGVRMALFALNTIEPGEEITFDYKLERFGDVPRKCLCKTVNCRGVFGAAKK